MVQKRHFDCEETLEVSSKHPRQVEPNSQLVSFSESVFPQDAPQIPHTPAGDCGQGGAEYDGKLVSDIPRNLGDLENPGPGSISVSSWATSSTSEEDAMSIPPVNLPFFPEYFSPERPIRPFARYEELYSILLEHSRKAVPLGPNHQADIPECYSQETYSAINQFEEDERRLMGTSVIPTPDSKTSPYDSDKVGNGRTACNCEDGGSIRCVRQHIAEAREKLVKNIGMEKFIELGFGDMGEQVAENWSTEEEQLIHDVIFANPASFGKNFWVILPNVFPLRMKKEIVSYYFNVFMLQRRAEQNRNERLNIDSDNDEWQGSDVLETHDEDDDSVVESPAYHDHPGHIHGQENDFQEYVGRAGKENGRGNVNVDFITRDFDDGKSCPRRMFDHDSVSSPVLQLQEKDERCNQEVRDDSCTSSDVRVISQVINVNHGTGDNFPSGLNGITSNGGSHEYAIEPYDAKVWEPGFISCSKNKVDLLPTRNMIEEVFGDGPWKYKARDDRA